MNLWWLLAALVLATLLVWQAARWAYDSALADLVATGEERLTLYAGTLRGELGQYAYLPYVVSHQHDVAILLKSNFNREQVNLYLEELNREAGSEALYVMNHVGDTLASSNWRLRGSFVGFNYGFRPYFTDSKEGKKGSLFAIGTTTGKPGYFMSHPVSQAGQFLGAAVVKVDLAPLQTRWREGGETVLVSDVNGVLFLSSRDDWRYRTLETLSEAQRTMILARRQYGDQPLSRLPLQKVQRLADNGRIVRHNGDYLLILSRPLSDFNWQLHQVFPLAPVRAKCRSVAISGAILVLLILASALYARERRQKQISRRQAREAQAIQQVNLRLQEEVAEHQRTEEVLRATQDELVQAGKLAALGHMAAGIVHELNQPIAAIRTHAASGRLLLERQAPDKLRETLAAISRMTEHMASITAQLKMFARKSPAAPTEQLVNVQDCLDGALSMTESLFSQSGVGLVKEIPQLPLFVSGDSGKLKQVLINLIRNAVDAVRTSAPAQVEIRIAAHDQWIDIQVADTGKGIAAESFDELFTPFYTTKDVGEGLGLGLSISYRIVTDFGGTIRAANRPGGGAQFSVRLPRLLAEGEQNEH